MATRKGIIKKTEISEFRNIRAGGLVALNLRDDDTLIGVAFTDGTKEIMIGTRGGMAIRFHEDNVRAMGRTASGVRSIDLNDGDEVVSMSPVQETDQILAISEKGYGKRTAAEEYRPQSRGGKGIKAMSVTEKTGYLAALMPVKEDDDLMMIADDGTIIRTAVNDISLLSRNTQGVRVMRLADSSRIVAVTATEKAEEEDEELLENENGETMQTEETVSEAVDMQEGFAGDEDKDMERLLERAENPDEEI